MAEITDGHIELGQGNGIQLRKQYYNSELAYFVQEMVQSLEVTSDRCKGRESV